MSIPNKVNHFWLDLDASSSMKKYEDTVVQRVDSIVRTMAIKSTELEQETRITITTFGSGKWRRDPMSTRKVLVWEMDVLRMPSIEGLYKAYGWTAMIEAVCESIKEMETIPVIHGDHAFAGYLFSDGDENDSPDKYALKPIAAGLPDNWTLAALVPNDAGKKLAISFGFPEGNVQIWDATSVQGVVDVLKVIEDSTTNFMRARATGVRGTKSLFTLKTVSVSDIQNKLKPVNVTHSVFTVLPHDVADDGKVEIRKFVVNRFGIPYKIGDWFYLLDKKETIQPSKQVVLRANGKFWYGDMGVARGMLGLPDSNVNVLPGTYNGYEIFVQSTSINRKFKPGAEILHAPGLNK